MGGADRYMYM